MKNIMTIDKISVALIQNICLLKEQNKNVSMLIKIEKDHIILKDKLHIYTISNIIEYRLVIDMLSNQYKCFLKYFPKSKNSNELFQNNPKVKNFII